jgi:hypothetical protein
MNALPSACPICGGEVVVTRFRCVACDSSVEGQFQPKQGAFSMLSPEQLQFIEVFVKCEGKLNRMESELDLSYPTIRARLTEIIRKMGYEPGKEEPEPKRKVITEAERRRILDELDAGRLTAEQAMKQLNPQTATEE